MPADSDLRPVLVRGRFPLAILVLALALAAVFAWGYATGAEAFGVAFPRFIMSLYAVCAGPTLAYLAIGVVAQLFRRRTATVTADGVVLRSLATTSTIADAEILAVGVSAGPCRVEGEMFESRRLLVVIEGRHEPEAWAFGPGDEAVEEFARRNLDRLRTASALLSRGTSVVFDDGWQADDDEIRFHRRPPLPWDRVSALDADGDRVALWRDDDAEPWGETPASSPNAEIFRDLATRHGKRRPRFNEPLSADSLGRRLHRLRPPGNHAALWALVAIPAVAAGLTWGYHDAWGRGAWATAAVSLALLVWSAVRHVRYLEDNRLDIYEHGVALVRGPKRVAVRYADMTSVHATARGELVVRFTRDGDAAKESFRAAARIRDESIEQIAEDLAGRVAATRLGELVVGDGWTWTDHLRILPDGLELCRNRGKDDAGFVLVPFDRAVGRIAKGVLTITLAGELLPAVVERAKRPEVYLGLAMLRRLQSRPKEGVAPPAETRLLRR